MTAERSPTEGGRALLPTAVERGVETAGWIIDLLGVATIVGGIVLASVLAVVDLRRSRATDPPPDDTRRTYRSYRQRLGRAILLGLEILVAADIIRTVAVAPSLTNVGVLGLIVTIRTVLSMTLEVELEGRWPWQHQR